MKVFYKKKSFLIQNFYVDFQVICYTYEEDDWLTGVAQHGVEVFLVLVQYTQRVSRYVDGIDHF